MRSEATTKRMVRGCDDDRDQGRGGHSDQRMGGPLIAWGGWLACEEGLEIEGDLAPEEVAFHAVGGLEFVEPFDFSDEVGLSEFTDP